MSSESFDGFGIQLPRELAELLSKGHDQARMAAEATATRVDTFIAGLDVDGLIALRTILNTGDMQQSRMANFFDGQLVSLLRYVHHVDPETGQEDPLTTAPVERSGD